MFDRCIDWDYKNAQKNQLENVNFFWLGKTNKRIRLANWWAVESFIAPLVGLFDSSQYLPYAFAQYLIAPSHLNSKWQKLNLSKRLSNHGGRCSRPASEQPPPGWGHGGKSEVCESSVFTSGWNSYCSSKSELKKRVKQRELDEKKQAKAAAAPPKAAKKMSAEEQESNLTPNVGL